MQNENLKKNEKSEIQLNNNGGIFSQIDLDTKKEIAKIGMTASMGITVATSFYMKNKFMKNLHIGAGVALVGFSFWHHILYQPDKKIKPQTKELPQDTLTPTNENYAISLNDFFIELSIKGKLTHKEVKQFTEKIEEILKEYKIASINLLVDLREIKGIELKALWEDIQFVFKHIDTIKKVAILGDNKFEEYSINAMDKIIQIDLSYFEDYSLAHKWLTK